VALNRVSSESVGRLAPYLDKNRTLHGRTGGAAGTADTQASRDCSYRCRSTSGAASPVSVASDHGRPPSRFVSVDGISVPREFGNRHVHGLQVIDSVHRVRKLDEQLWATWMSLISGPSRPFPPAPVGQPAGFGIRSPSTLPAVTTRDRPSFADSYSAPAATLVPRSRVELNRGQERPDPATQPRPGRVNSGHGHCHHRAAGTRASHGMRSLTRPVGRLELDLSGGLNQGQQFGVQSG
jgi:hypothetical protein